MDSTDNDLRISNNYSTDVNIEPPMDKPFQMNGRAFQYRHCLMGKELSPDERYLLPTCCVKDTCRYIRKQLLKLLFQWAMKRHLNIKS